ncbi:MAG: FHA domain-containing protein [Bacteroidetes bacterium]|nr:FHA domain-containing protein [Bacteroidota bacterium]MCW5897109.1 FHA domain-containing protein [Bacteroidota bacterium]
MMKARLFCKTGQLAGASFEIGREATIGKAPGNSIQLYPQSISGNHARIFFDEKEKKYIIEDLGSRNGTRLDGVRVRGRERLSELHIITFSNTFDFLFQVMEDSSQQQNNKPDEQAIQKQAPPKASVPDRKTKISDEFVPLPSQSNKEERAGQGTEERQKTVFDDGAFSLPAFQEIREQPVSEDVQRTKVGIDFTPVPSFVEPSKPPKPAAPESLPHYVLIFEGLKGGPAAFDLKEGSMIVGREQSSAIFIDDGSMSRKHAEFVLKEGTLTLKDLGSKNHTYINNQKISKEVEVREGISITFGIVKARLVRKPSK